MSVKATQLPAGLQSFSLEGKLVLITGSSGGIGLALARGMAEAGAAIVLNGRDAAKLAKVAQQLREQGYVIHESSFDATSAEAVQAAVQKIESDVGAIDVLVNNAGIQRRNALEDFKHEDWHDIINTNLNSVFYAAQAVARHMIVRGQGKIINICSVQSELGRPNIAPYAATKGAVKMFTKGMAIDWGKYGIQVNGLGPGYFKTEMNMALVQDQKFTEWLVGRTPSRRWGDVEDLVGAAVFLGSDASRFVNGHILYVDGGVTATL
jgi:gluconate 5-dehydrogenase